ncbi:MAG: nickel-dependent hydrogenase large subunit [Candidatus Omnitrophica bacterium]|nr:nickel-dependent hydrogenase large subunit [Candidatus Omnitrophota bacterium]MBU1905745.1 nickel-dependent hydrogenase large subunit [Candidatus Omnitrophota bacterium]
MSHKVIVPIGPYHPLQEEPEFFRLHVDGEKVTDIDIIIGYMHRGIEELSEHKHFHQVPYLVERICGICSSSHPYAYVLAIEDILGGEANVVPERALYIRTIVDELQRLHSHLLWLGLAGHFIGYNTVWMWAWRYREPLLDLFEMITGNRNHYGISKIGGVIHDIKDEDIPAIKKAMDDLVPAANMFKGAVMDDPVIHARLKGVGILTKQQAIDWCTVGPTARASGVDIDVRRDDPYGVFDKVKWNVIVEKEGDVFAKAVVRILELYESVGIIRQCLDKMPKGPIDADIKDIPPGEGIGHVEAPRGECFHYVRSDGTNRPVRHKIRAPSYVNIASNKVAAVGQTISDTTITLAAVDPCYCCTERVAVLDKKTDKQVLNGWDLIKLSQEKTEKIKKRMGINV